MTFGALLRGVVRWIVIGGLAGLALIGLVAGLARFGDGPIGPLPGGALRRGDLVSASGVDWSFAENLYSVELQLLSPPRSRTTWLVVHGGELYVPCGFLEIPGFKQWPHEAESDGRAVVRIEGRRYPMRAVRVKDPRLYARVAERVARKYGLGEGQAPDPERLWIFRLEPRAAAES